MPRENLPILIFVFFASAAAAQTAPPDADPPPPAALEEDVTPPATETATEALVPESYDDPYSAYGAGAYEQALQGFVDQQVENPENPEVALNLGNVHYR